MVKLLTAVLRAIVLTLAVVALPITAFCGEATPIEPDADRGKQLAERLCVNCHVVSKDVDREVPEGVPPFKVIANKPGQSGDHIRNILMQPHASMPAIGLTRLEMDDIIAYLDELRPEGSNPPLLQHKKQGPALPENPEPS